ncbi:MAG: SpoIIE family protein phosphatase [Victivallaceae bacterium]|nr:SpoIIE family protein phosphatase [Victivallaceae bacterium]
MRLSDHSMAFRLSFYCSAVLFLVFLVSAGVIGFFGWKILNRQLEERCVAAVNDVARRLNQEFGRAQVLADTLGRAIEAQDKLTVPELQYLMRTSFEDAAAGDPYLVGLDVSFEPDQLVPGEKYNSWLIRRDNENDGFKLAQIGGEQLQYFYRDWYIVPKHLGRGLWTNPFYSEGGIGGRVLSYSSPFSRATGGERSFRGVVMVDIDVEAMRSLFSRMELSDVGFGFLLSKFGQIVIHPNADLENNQTLFSLFYQYKDEAGRAAGRGMMADPAPGTVSYPKLPFFSGGTQVFYATTDLNGWKVCVAVPSGWVRNQLFGILGIVLGAFLAVAVLSVAGVTMVARRMSRPLETLAKAANRVGRGDFSAPLPATEAKDEIGELTTAFSTMQRELSKYIEEVKSSVAARERIEGELNAARAIQNDILPKLLPPLPDCPTFSLAPALRPARAIGGDMYDIFFLDKDHLLIMVGDVSGKGIAAALFMAIASTLQRNIAASSSQPAEIVRRLNHTLAQNNNAMMFLTSFLGVLNVSTGELEYCNAGHNPPLCLRADGGCEELRILNGPPLGINEDAEYTHNRLKLVDGDTLILYTDGVTEAFNSAGDMFTLARLRETGAELARSGKSPAEMLDSILQTVDDFAAGCEQSDDITLLIMRFNH